MYVRKKEAFLNLFTLKLSLLLVFISFSFKIFQEFIRNILHYGSYFFSKIVKIFPIFLRSLRTICKIFAVACPNF